MEPIPFGKKRALLVKDSSRRMLILNSLRRFASVRLWEKSVTGLKTRDDVQPVSYETFQRLRQTPHLARFVPESRNKRGVKRACPEFFLFLTTLPDSSRKICCMIEKRCPLDSSRIYQLRFRFRESLFSGSLLSGVFLQTTEDRAPERMEVTEGFGTFFKNCRHSISAPQRQKNWLFLADDIWIHKGKDIPLPLAQRLVCLQDLLGMDLYPDSRLDVCDFAVARYADYNTIEDFLRNERKYFPFDISDHKVTFVSTQGTPGLEEHKASLAQPVPTPSMDDSVIFRNGEWSMQGGTGAPLYKPSSDTKSNSTSTSHTQSLSTGQRETMRLEKSEFPDVYWVVQPTSGKRLGAARVRSLQESQLLRERFQEVEQSAQEDGKSHLMITCVFEEEFLKWRPLLITH